MNTKMLSNRALSVVDQYIHFRFGSAVTSVPYFNNKTVRARAALRVYVGKGSPEDIYEEAQALSIKNHIDPSSLADESLKKLLTDNNIGIECSGFAYYVLNAESFDRGRGTLDKHITFVNCGGLFGKMRCSLRPAENCDVATFAHDKNSSAIHLKDVQPGDIITMTGSSMDIASDPNAGSSSERDHILVIHQIEYQNFLPTKIHYSHAVAYPEDGVYGTGARRGVIEITDLEKPLTESLWFEDSKIGSANRLFVRAQKSNTQLRRLKLGS